MNDSRTGVTSAIGKWIAGILAAVLASVLTFIVIREIGDANGSPTGGGSTVVPSTDQRPRLTVQQPSGGRVTSDGILCPPTCSRLVDPGQSVTLTAQPSAGNMFTGWGGACTGTGACTLVMASDKTVSAGFGNSGSPDVTNRQVVRSGRIILQPGKGGEAVANCPAGTVSVGGGHWFRSPFGVVVDVSRPTSGQGWYLHGFNPDSGAHDFEAEAVCATVRDREVVTASLTVQPGQGGATVAICPAGKVSTGGGGSTASLVIDVSRPAISGQGWELHVLNVATVTRTATAYAVCATAPSRVTVTASLPVEPGSNWAAEAACPANTVSTGGGHFFESTTGLSLTVDEPSGKGWDLEAHNSTEVHRTVTAYAVCATGS